MTEQVPEKTIFQSPNVMITNSRAVLEDTTYSMSNITSVKKEIIKANRATGLIIALAGFIIGGCLGGTSDKISLGLFLGGAIVLVGIAMMIDAKTKYAVTIGSASGETKAMKSRDEDEIQKIVDAINQAIITRG